MRISGSWRRYREELFEPCRFRGNSIKPLLPHMRYPLLLLLSLLVSILPSCQTPAPTGSDYLAGIGGAVPTAPTQLGITEHISYWDDDGSKGSPHIVVDLHKQVAEFYHGGKVIGVAAISSGKEGRNTPPGEYKILEKQPMHFSAQYGCVYDGENHIVNEDATPKSAVPPGCRYQPAPMPWFMRIRWDGVGMHEGYLPGCPASHGCIRMDRNIVQTFYKNSYVGMPVIVVN